jgi:hypothetical protein
LSRLLSRPARGHCRLRLAKFIRSFPWTAGLCLLFLEILYIALFQRYRAYEIDNPWYLSFSRNYWVARYPGDFFLNGVFPDGMEATAVFGRLAGLTQGLVLNDFAWRPFPAMLLSSALVIPGLVFWYRVLRQGGLSAAKSSALILATL